MSENRTFDDASTPEIPRRRASGAARWARRILRALLPLLVLAAGVLGAWRYLSDPVKPQRKTPTRGATAVRTSPVHHEDRQVVVEATGEVVAAREVVLQPRLSGEVVSVSEKFVPGVEFDDGEEILRIDPNDYKVVAAQRASELATAEYDLKNEEAQQAVARREFELLGEDVDPADRDLVLRRPQLEVARKRLAAAEAALKEAELDVKRTTLRAPFHAVILERASINKGAQVSPQTRVATLVGADRCWVRVSLPVSDLRWVEMPVGERPGSKAEVRNDTGWPKGVHRTGRVVQRMAGLVEQGRLAQLLVEVADPFVLDEATGDEPPLLHGSFVRVRILGKTLRNVVVVPRSAVHDGDTVWIMTDEDKLDIREIDILWADRERVFLTNQLAESERLIVTELATPVQGMALRVEEERGDAEASEPADGPAASTGDAP